MLRSRHAILLSTLSALLFAQATTPIRANAQGATSQGEAVKQQYLQQAQAQAQADAAAKAARSASEAAQNQVAPTHTNTPPPPPVRPPYNATEIAIISEMKTLRATPDSERGAKTIAIAKEIGALPGDINKLQLADNLSHLSTEGDFGHEMLQVVASTLAAALTQNPLAPPVDAAGKIGRPILPYFDVAKLVRYEHVDITLKDPEYTRAQALLIADEADVNKVDFTLTDLSGKPWTLSALRGKVVLVNFWATWCPLCRKEMPDLDTLAHRFESQGLVVLSLSDEDRPKVADYISSHNLKYPVLLDTNGATAKSFHVQGIPKTFIFDRNGKLASQSIDMRTQGQFLQMLAQAGIQ